MISTGRLRRDPLIRVHPVHLQLRYPWLSVLYLPSVASVCSVVHRGFFCDLVLLGDLCVLARGQVLVVTTFVQQLKRQNTPRVRNSLSLWAQGVTRLSGLVRAQNSGTIRATRPLYGGTVCSEAEPLGFMIYEL